MTEFKLRNLARINGAPAGVILGKPKKTPGFFIGVGKKYELRRWLKLHQDEPVNVTEISRVCGYASSPACAMQLGKLMKEGKVRRYQAPEDRYPNWRYQYVPPELSGVIVRQLETAEAPEEVKRFEAERLEVANEVPEVPVKTELQVAAELVDKYAREFLWTTGSRDIKELTLWLKERYLNEN